MRNKRKSTLNTKAAMTWAFILVVSFLLFYFGATNIFDEGSFRMVLRDKWYWLLMTAAGIFFMLIAIWQLSADQIGAVSAFFARLGRRRIGPIYHYIPQSIHANTRNAKNLIGFLTLGVALVTGLMVIADTIQLGNVAMNHSYLGGDVIVFNPMIPRSSLPEIRGISGIESATTYTGVVMENWKYNFGTEYSYVVNTADGYGGRDTNVTQNLNVLVIEPDEYLLNNPPGSPIHNELSDFTPSIYEINKPNSFEDPSSFIHRLDQPMTTIVGNNLLKTLGKDIGDTITISINGFMGDLEIVGSASNLPAVPYMKLLDNVGYMTRSLVISRSTFSKMLGDFVGNVDIFIKNMTLPERMMNKNYSYSEKIAGYTSGLIDMNSIDGNLSIIDGIDKIAYRFSTFAPGIPSLNGTYNPSQLVWKHKTINITTGEEFPLPLRMYVVDGREDLFITGWQERVASSSTWAGTSFSPPSDPDVKSLLDWYYSKSINTTASNVLYLIDKYAPDDGSRSSFFGGNGLCVANRYVVAYEDIDNETYVYEMKPMDVIKFSIPMDDNTTKSFNFTIAATIDNQLAYWWGNGSMREGFKMSSKSLNYNFKENESSDLQDFFDLDANVFITTRGEFGYMAYKMFGVPSFIGIDELNGLQADEIANHVQIKVKSGFNVTEVANQIRAMLNAMHGGNFSVLEYKQAFIGRLANTGALAVNILSGTTETTALANLETWFESKGYTWNIAHVGTLERQNLGSDIVIAGPLFRIFFVVAIFSLVINAIGLCTILYANARKRHREYGIYKALGYTSHAIREMIFFETFLVTSIGIISGTIAGIAMMLVLYQAVKTTLVIPMLFSIPIWTISCTIASLIFIAVLTSEAISRHVTRLSIVDNIRYRE